MHFTYWRTKVIFGRRSVKCKNELIKDVKPFIKDIQRKREKAKDIIKEFMIDGKDLDYKDKN